MAGTTRIPEGARSALLYSFGGVEIIGPSQITARLERWPEGPGAADDEDAMLAHLGLAPGMTVTATFSCRPFEGTDAVALDEEAVAPPGRFRCLEVNVVGNPSTVTSTAMGRLSLPRILRSAIADNRGEFRVRTLDNETNELVTRRFLEPAELGLAGCWAYGRMIGADPTKYVADAFSIARTAAAQRLARARSADPPQIPPTKQGAR